MHKLKIPNAAIGRHLRFLSPVNSKMSVINKSKYGFLYDASSEFIFLEKSQKPS